MGNPWQSYGASLAIWDHRMLPATRHKWTHPAISPTEQAGTRFTYLGRMEGWVDLGSLIAAWPGIEPTTAWSQVRRPNHSATESPTVLLVVVDLQCLQRLTAFWSMFMWCNWCYCKLSSFARGFRFHHTSLFRAIDKYCCSTDVGCIIWSQVEELRDDGWQIYRYVRLWFAFSCCEVLLNISYNFFHFRAVKQYPWHQLDCMDSTVGNATRVPGYPKTRVTRPFSNP